MCVHACVLTNSCRKCAGLGGLAGKMMAQPSPAPSWPRSEAQRVPGRDMRTCRDARRRWRTLEVQVWGDSPAWWLPWLRSEQDLTPWSFPEPQKGTNLWLLAHQQREVKAEGPVPVRVMDDLYTHILCMLTCSSNEVKTLHTCAPH